MARIKSRGVRSLLNAVPLAAALLAAGCGTTVDDGFWTKESEGLAGTASESVYPPRWTNSAKIAVQLRRPTSASGAFEACVTASALDAAAPVVEGAAWSCASPAVKVTFGTNDETKTAANVTLPAGEGLKRVWARFSDKTGSGAFVDSVESATVLVDKTPPTQRPGSATIRGAESSIIVTVNAGATDFGGSGLAGYKLVHSPSSAPKAGCTTGTPLACRANRNVLTCAGLKNGARLAVRLCAVDRAGNPSPGIVNDYVVPVPAWHQDQPPTNVSLVLRSTPNVASGGKVDVTLSGSSPDGTKLLRYCIAEEGADCTLAAIKPEAVSVSQNATITLSNAKTSGRRTLVGQVVDAYGLVGTATLSFDYDLTPPADAAMTVSVEPVDHAVRVLVDAAPLDTDKFVASATKGGSADPVAGCLAKTASGGNPESFVLTAVGGNKTDGWLFDAAKFVNGGLHKVRVCAVDAAGNVSAGKVRDAVTYKAAPTGSIVVGAGSTSAAAIADGTVKVTLSAKGVGSAKVTSYFLTTSLAAGTTRDWSNFTTPAASAKQTLASVNLGAAGLKTLYAWFKDDLGNESPAPVTVQTYRDGRTPEVALSKFSVLPWAGGSFQVSVGVVVTEDSGLLKSLDVKLFPNATATGTSKAMTCAAVGPLMFDCSGVVTVPGEVSISASATDLVGNQSDVELLEGEDVGVDLTAPTGFDGSGTLRATSLSYAVDGTLTALLEWDEAPESDVVAYLVVRSDGDVPPDDCDSGTFVGSTAATSLLVPGLAGEPQAFRVCAVDWSGNVSAGKTAVLGGGRFRIAKVNGLAAKRVNFVETDPVVEGIAEPNAAVELFSMGVGKVGTATANADGVWQLSLTGRDSYLLAARSTDKDGKPVQSPPVEVTLGTFNETPAAENLPMSFDTPPYDKGNTFTLEGVAPAWSDGGGSVFTYRDNWSVAGTAPKAGYLFALRNGEAGTLLATVTAGTDKRWAAGPFPLLPGQAYAVTVEKPGAAEPNLFDFTVMHSSTYPAGPHRDRYVAGSTLEAPKYRGLGKVDGTGGALARFGAVRALKEAADGRVVVGHAVDAQTHRLAELDLWSGAVRDLGAWDGRAFAPAGGRLYSYGPSSGSSSGGLLLRGADGSQQLVAADVVADREVVDMAGDGRRVAVLTQTKNTDPARYELRLFTLAEDGASAGAPLLVAVPWEHYEIQNPYDIDSGEAPPSGVAFGPDGRLCVQRARLWRLDEQAQRLEERPSKLSPAALGGLLSFDASGRVLRGSLLETFPRAVDTASGVLALLTRSGFLVVARMGGVTAKATAFVPAQATMLTATAPWELSRLLDLGVLVADGGTTAAPPTGYESCAEGADATKGCPCASGWGNGFNECRPCGTGAHRISYGYARPYEVGLCACDDFKDGDPYVSCADVPADGATLCGGSYKTLDDATRSIGNTTYGYGKDYAFPYARADWQGSGWYRLTGTGGSTLASFDPAATWTCDTYAPAAPCSLSRRCGTPTQLYLVEGQPTTGAVEWKKIGAGANYGSTPLKPTPYTVGAIRCTGFNLYYLPDVVSKSLDGGWCASP